jgi:hypothetical protein
MGGDSWSSRMISYCSSALNASVGCHRSFARPETESSPPMSRPSPATVNSNGVPASARETLPFFQ